nr:MAG TPA: hypothetical protein [Caudoviricetes sp.]
MSLIYTILKKIKKGCKCCYINVCSLLLCLYLILLIIEM